MKPPAVNYTMIYTFSGGDKSLEKELISAYIRQSDLDLVLLKEALSDTNEEQWAKAIYMLRSSAGSVGAMTLYDLCGHALPSLSLKEKQEIYEKVKSEYARVKKFLLGQ